MTRLLFRWSLSKPAVLFRVHTLLLQCTICVHWLTTPKRFALAAPTPFWLRYVQTSSKKEPRQAPCRCLVPLCSTCNSLLLLSSVRTDLWFRLFCLLCLPAFLKLLGMPCVTFLSCVNHIAVSSLDCLNYHRFCFVRVCKGFAVLLHRAGDADYAWKKMGKHPMCNHLLQLACLSRAAVP